MENPLKDKRVFILGGSSGIGYHLAQACLQEEAFVTIQGKTGTPAFKDFCSRSRAAGMVCDLNDKQAIPYLCKEAGNADILCIVYGPFLQKTLDAVTSDEWERIVYANLTVPGILASAVLPQMIKRKWGRLLFFGGTETHILRGFKTNAVYGAAKMGIMSLVRSISMVYASYGITANAICPGFTDTALLTDRQRKDWAAKSPDGLLLSPDAITAAALFLLKEGACNGVIMPVDKGWSSFGSAQQ